MSSSFRIGSSLRPSLLTIALAAALQSGNVWAVEPFVLKDIRVEGLQRTDPGTVFASLPFRIGDTYSDEKGSAALRALFATGLFKDVRIAIDGTSVVVVIDERPVIANVSFVGLKEFDTDVLTKSLKDVGIGEGLPFDKALADRAEQELKRQYLTRSLYGAEVVTTITPIERNRVNVSFSVTEGSPAKIGEIRILGSKAFSESSLRGLLEQTSSGWLTWYTKTDRYSRSKLNADLETLRSHYLNRGYLEFAIESVQVTISPDKQSINISVTVNEGQPYTVTAIKMEGEYFGREADFKSLILLKPGQPYRGELVAKTTRAFSDLFGSYGYAFARVDSRPEIDRNTGQVVVTFVSEPQRRVYVRRLNVSGNSRTRDEVVRREFRQFESAWYDGQRIKLSTDRVNRLGYFSDATVETSEVAGAPDQVDLTVIVKEKPTGAVSVGAGYSSAQKLSFNGSIRQDNVFGSGHYLGFEVNTGKTGRALVLSTVDPYFTVDGISRGLDLGYRTVRPYNNLGETYQYLTYNAGIRFGVPMTEFDTVFLGLGYERNQITTDKGLPENLNRYRELFGEISTSIPLTLGWQRDQRDSVLAPTAGKFQRVNLEMSPLGDTRYARANLQYQQFFPLISRFSWGLNAELGWGAGLAGRPYPVFKNFQGGGLGSVRVFQPGTLGPVDITNSYIGGNRRINVNAELYVPVPGAGNDKTFRLFGFFDAGNVWAEHEKLSASDLRTSIGIGISWISPMGPLKLSWGTPLSKKPTDRIEKLQFQIGTAF